MVEIGIPPLDSDHRHLMAMLDDLARAARDGAGALLLEDQSLEVVASLESHFAKEERMLEEAKDAQRHRHIACHGELLDRLARMTGEHLAQLGPLGASDAIHLFMRELQEEIDVFDLPAAPGILSIQKN